MTLRIVEVVATLAAPVVLTDEMHLDGLLASAHPLCRGAPIGRDTPLSRIVDPPIPVMNLSDGGVSVRLCTVADAAPSARLTTSQVVKRRDAEDIASLARPVHLGLGPGKNRLGRLPVVVTPTLTWRAVGERRGIVRLLNRITCLGTWRSAGYGQVCRWDVTVHPTDTPEQVLVSRDGRAQRTIPTSWTEWAETTVTGAIQAPYWHPARLVASCVPVGARCVLRPTIIEAVRRAAHHEHQVAHRKRHESRRETRRLHG